MKTRTVKTDLFDVDLVRSVIAERDGLDASRITTAQAVDEVLDHFFTEIGFYPIKKRYESLGLARLDLRTTPVPH